jgi:hydrogenase maturation factor
VLTPPRSPTSSKRPSCAGWNGGDRRLPRAAHVSVVIGAQPYEFFAEEFAKPVVIAGFEPLDVMQSILMLIRQINEGTSFEWRGLGTVPYSALKIREAYEAFDAAAGRWPS